MREREIPHDVRMTIRYMDDRVEVKVLNHKTRDSWNISMDGRELILRRGSRQFGMPREHVQLAAVRSYELEMIPIEPTPTRSIREHPLWQAGYDQAMADADLLKQQAPDAPSDDLVEFENAIAQRMGDNFDGDEGQQAIIFRWLDAVEAKMAELSGEWAAYFFMSGPMPDGDEARDG